MGESQGMPSLVRCCHPKLGHWLLCCSILLFTTVGVGLRVAGSISPPPRHSAMLSLTYRVSLLFQSSKLPPTYDLWLPFPSLGSIWNWVSILRLPWRHEIFFYHLWGSASPSQFISFVAVSKMMTVRGRRCHLMFMFRKKQVAEQPMFEQHKFLHLCGDTLHVWGHSGYAD